MMRTKLSPVVYFLFVVLFSLGVDTAVQAQTEETAVVVRVVDGDTIIVNLNGTEERLRYIGMDTPETDEPYFDQATEANRLLVDGQTVRLVRDVSDRDRYGRLLRYIYLSDGTFVNAELVRQGWARAAAYPPDTAHVDEFAQLEAEAYAARLGIWQNMLFLPLLVNGSSNTAVPPTENQVGITTIFYDGLVPQVESDEYAVIENWGDTAVTLTGWRLNAGDEGQDFYFPDYLLLPGESCAVYTNEIHPECGFSFGSSRALWANEGDCGYLYDNTDSLVSEYCYDGE